MTRALTAEKAGFPLEKCRSALGQLRRGSQHRPYTVERTLGSSSLTIEGAAVAEAMEAYLNNGAQGGSAGLDEIIGAPLSPQMLALFREAMQFDSPENKDVASHVFVVFGASVSRTQHFDLSFQEISFFSSPNTHNPASLIVMAAVSHV